MPPKQRPKGRGKRAKKHVPAPSPQPISFPIVGVGASAGGLEAFADIIRHMPPDAGLAIVFVQHFDPHHKSAAPEILGRATRLPVVEARNGLVVEPNNVYVIPANAELRIRKGALVVSRRATQHGFSKTIDRFLVSLARDRKSDAISVILSGMSADGSNGTMAIRRAGGHTFAQDDLTAKYNAMPYSAIQTGSVEFIRSPQGIAEDLIRLGHGRMSGATMPAPTPLRNVSPETLRILEILRERTGVDFTRYKPATIERRIARRVAHHRMRRLQDYAAFLSRDHAEPEELYNDLLIHVTSFFRNGNTFEFLQKQVFPALLKKRSVREPVRIWVPACSTGEEAYSIAMLLHGYLDKQGPHVPFQIFGTDVSAGAIQKARAGVYPEEIAKDVGAARLRKFFVKVERGYQVSKAIRQSIIFATHDVTTEPPFSKMDLISCRNLMIYLGPDLQARLIPMFHYALKPNGFLVLGPAETVGPFTNLFGVVDRKKKIYSKKAAKLARMDFLQRGRLVDPPVTAVLPELAVSPDARREADRLVLAKFAPAGVIVNEDWEVLHFRGKTASYLEHPTGDARLSLFKMAKEGLLPGLRATLEAARKTNLPSRSQRIRVGQDGDVQDVFVEAIPLKSDQRERQFLVLFEEPPKVASARPVAKAMVTVKKVPAVTDGRVAELEEELAATKQYLQAVIESQEAINEELQSANEEVLSNNEELQSTNEELETAQEELQSANEELTTLNEELQNRNASLALIYNDLNNLVNNINIPVVIVGNDLRIRRFTPAAEKLLNLIASDVGRPIGNIRPNLEVRDLETLVREALSSLGTQEIEVKDREDRRYALRVRPYRTEDNKIDGAVIALVDVEQLRSSLDHVTESLDYAQAIVETVQQPLIVLDRELKVIHGNASFHTSFPVPPRELEAKMFFELNSGQWSIAPLHERLSRLAAEGEGFERLQIEMPAHARGRGTPRGGDQAPRILQVSARRVRAGSWAAHILLTIEDVTAEKVSEEKMRKLNEDLESFSYSVTHDLRTPLHAIRGFAQSLVEIKGKQLDADGRHYAANILEGASRMSRIIEDLLQLSWASRGDLKKDDVDVGALSREIIGRLSAQEPTRKVDVKIERGLEATADTRLMEIVLENLLANAWKFTSKRPDAVIEVGAKKTGHRTTFFVRDNGIGFDMAYASRLFQAFQRLHTPGQFPGTGIGLATVKRIVQRHGGRVWAEGVPGKGATFFFTLNA